jgi:hypothetical protein
MLRNNKSYQYTYGFISLVAEIGGYSGLMLGISVLDLTKVASKYLHISK